MNLVELTEEIVKSLVVNKDSVSVKEFPTEEENVILIQVMVSDDDMGRVIGKNGKTSTSIRTIIQAFAAINNMPKVKINIDSF